MSSPSTQHHSQQTPEHKPRPPLFASSDDADDAGVNHDADHAALRSPFSSNPLRISRITPVRNRSRPTDRLQSDSVPRFAIYAGRRKVGILPGEAVGRLDLHPDSVLDSALLSEIARESLICEIRRYAWRLIDTRLYSCAHLRARLIRKFSADAGAMIDGVIGNLQEIGALDDAVLASALVASLQRTNRPAGPRLVRQRLVNAGIEDSVLIERCVAEVTASHPDRQSGNADLSDFLETKYRQSITSPGDRRIVAMRLYRLGVSRGFDPDEVRACVASITGMDATDRLTGGCD